MIWALWVSCSGRACWSLPAFHLPRPEPTKLEIGGVHKPESTPVPPTPTIPHTPYTTHHTYTTFFFLLLFLSSLCFVLFSCKFNVSYL